MTNATQVSTYNLLSFINGNAIDAYGDTDAAKRVIHVLGSSMDDAVMMAHTTAVRQKKVESFVTSVYSFFYSCADHGLRSVSEAFRKAWLLHYHVWKEQYTNTKPAGDIQCPILGDAEETTKTTLNQISATLLQWYLRSIENLAAEENKTPLSISLPRAVDNISRIPLEEWDYAWQTEFHGSVLRRLEKKLCLNVHAVTEDKNKRLMSRIIPAVQSSGTGKSRLAEE